MIAKAAAKITSLMKSDKFFANSAIVFCGSLLVGVINYLYQFLMARMLSVEDYGDLQSLFAVISVVGVLTTTLSMTAMKYAADFYSRNESHKLRAMFGMLAKRAWLFALIVLSAVVISCGQIAHFLNLRSVLPALVAGISPVIGFPGAVNSAILSGLHKFKAVTGISITAALTKLLFAVVTVSFGFALQGAIGAVAVAAIIGYFVSFYPIKDFLKMPSEPICVKEIYKYSLPVFGTIFFTSLLLNTNVILVKHFFSPQAAGEYGAIAVIGNLIYFLVGPIGAVMFPMSAHAHGSKNFPAKVLKKSLFIVGFLGAASLIAFFILPNLVITILVGKKFLSIGPYLGWFGLSVLMYSFSSMFANYFLSINKTKSVFIVAAGAIAQIVLIYLFHQNLSQVIWIINLTTSATLATLMGYFIVTHHLCRK